MEDSQCLKLIYEQYEREISYRIPRDALALYLLENHVSLETHIYTFENTCKEDKSVLLGDITTKVFLNGDGKIDNVSAERKAFLDYVSGKPSPDFFLRKLEEAVREAKKNREWRHEYMTLLMRDQENIEKGIIKGIRGAVELLREAGWADDEIKTAIKKKYILTENEAEEYIYSNVCTM